MPPASQPFIADENTPRLPNGQILVPRGAGRRQGALSPLDPDKSLTGAQKVWINDRIAAAFDSFRETVRTLTEALEKLDPETLKALMQTKPTAPVKDSPVKPPAQATLPTPPAGNAPGMSTSPDSAPGSGSEPATADAATDPALTPQMLALLATVTQPALRKKVIAIFRKDAPEPVRMAEARAAIKPQQRKEETLGNAVDGDE